MTKMTRGHKASANVRSASVAELKRSMRGISLVPYPYRQPKRRKRKPTP